MIFQELATWYAVYNATSKIKRYITGVKLVFGKTYSLATFPPISYKAPSPVGNKLAIFNTTVELLANRAYTGVNEYLDTTTYSEIKDIILDPTIVKDLMESADPYLYVRQTSFNAGMIYKGMYKRFRFNPSYMALEITFTTDAKVYEKFQAAAAYEKDCNAFVLSAQRNARALAKLGLDTKLSAAERSKLNVEITNHQAVVNQFKSKLPPGFYLDTRSLSADQISGAHVGVIPVIIWVVALVVAGIVGLTAYYITRQADIKTLKTSLDARYNAIMSISDDKLRNEALVKAAESTSTTIENQASNTGVFGQFKQIVLIGGIVWLAKTIMGK